MGKRPPPSVARTKPPPSRRSFVVRLDEARPADSGDEVTAHITPVVDLHAVLNDCDVRLGSTVSGIIADLLAEIVREEEEESGA